MLSDELAIAVDELWDMMNKASDLMSDISITEARGTKRLKTLFDNTAHVAGMLHQIHGWAEQDPTGIGDELDSSRVDRFLDEVWLAFRASFDVQETVDELYAEIDTLVLRRMASAKAHLTTALDHARSAQNML